MSVEDSRPVEFTAAELWMLNDVIRHDEDGIPKKKWPKVSTSLNGDIALAILACEDSDLKAYTLALSLGDILVLDANIRRDMKTPEGAKGKEILLKLFKARYELAYGPLAEDGEDLAYRVAIDRKTFEPKEENDASTNGPTDNGPDEVAV